MAMIELTDDEMEIIRRFRLSPSERKAEDSVIMDAHRALSRAEASPAQKAEMDRFDALSEAKKRAIGVISRYSAALRALPAVQNEVNELAKEADPIVDVPKELLAVSAEPRVLASAPRVIEAPVELAEEAEPPVEITETAVVPGPVSTPGIFTRMVNAVLGR